jgi:hypothetical protein
MISKSHQEQMQSVQGIISKLSQKEFIHSIKVESAAFVKVNLGIQKEV